MFRWWETNVAVSGENPFKLQALTEKHKDVAALLAQGMGPLQISKTIDFTPQYVTMLCRDPLFKDYLRTMSEFAEARHEALFGKTAEVCAVAMMGGTIDEQLKAARLNLEVTGRIGKNDRPQGGLDNSHERLITLAERLTALLHKARQGETIDGQFSHGEAVTILNHQVQG